MTVRGARWQWFVGLIALLGLLALSGCSGSDSPPASAATADTGNSPVAIRLFQFQPSPLEVTAGTTVTWTNGDDILHTVTSGAPGAKDGRFDGTLDGSGTSYMVTFSEPGTYAYFCSRHESMRGEVRVN
ncbi:MAG TPA: plastocyanin/azurin family copper-binding protein [Thermomicrobiales bacterium]|nr:plastocyanin/azurin family copper-binding protein [Thermomicrobiales bacterium]